MMMMMMIPFTESQLKELELQTIIFNHMASGIPVPSHLIDHFRRSFCFLDPYPLHISMNYGGRRAEEDAEPWRCKRTDGKKWRCSKEAFQDSKYCERHMHRGKKSSRKLVELPAATTNATGFPTISSSSSSSSSQLFLGSATSFRSGRYNFFEEEGEEQQQQKKHCYVLGADLLTEKPAVGVEREPPTKPLLWLFGDQSCDEKSKVVSWGDQEDAYSKTQLSISIP